MKNKVLLASVILSIVLLFQGLTSTTGGNVASTTGNDVASTTGNDVA